MDNYRFLQAKDFVVFSLDNKDHIGELNEKFLHAILKKYLEWDEKYHEVKIQRFVADVCFQNQIYEIQTRNFEKLKKKLDVFLTNYHVEVVYPMTHFKYICYLDENKRRRSPKVGSLYQVFKELYKIKHLLRVKLIPELDELDNKLKTNTVEDIIEDHPEMDKIIRKRKEISKELELWQKKIDLMNMQNN